MIIMMLRLIMICLSFDLQRLQMLGRVAVWSWYHDNDVVDDDHADDDSMII